MKHEVAISVRALVEYAFRSGSIEPGFHSAASMAEGTRIHQKIQTQYKEEDQKEVYLRIEIPHKELLFIVDGRCDGLLVSEAGELIVEEIKSTFGPLDLLGEGREVHWAQALMYAFMISYEQGLSSIQVRLTYVRRDGEEQRSLHRRVSIEELSAFAADTVAKYAPYAEMLLAHEMRKESSIRELSFPLPCLQAGTTSFSWSGL